MGFGFIYISSHLIPFYSFALKANTTRRRTRTTNNNLTYNILIKITTTYILLILNCL